MASLRMQTADALVFQLLSQDLTVGDGWKEKQVYIMNPKPARIQYAQRGRGQYTQTTPEHGFLDRFGLVPSSVAMQGTFGIIPRRNGITFKDGYTRFIEFRDEIFRISHFAGEPAQGEHEMLYALNWYDFINAEKFAVDIEDFAYQLDARYNSRERTYNMNLKGIGPIIAVVPKDPLLVILLGIDALLSAGEAELDNAMNYLTNNPVYQGVAYLVDGYDVMLGSLSTLAGLAGLYKNSMSPLVATFSQPAQATKNAFGMIKF